MVEPARILERAADGVGDILELAEDRRRAWLVSLAGLVAVASCWWIAIAVSNPVQPVVGPPDRTGTLVGLAFLLVVIAAAFVAAFAALQAIIPKPAAVADTEPAFLGRAAAQAASDRRRRVGLASALVAAINAAALHVLTRGLS